MDGQILFHRYGAEIKKGSIAKMIDREKVIKELEERIKVAEECMGNPMFTPDAIRTIVALLKEQEAVEPKQIGQGWFCGACDALLSIGNEKIVKFCSMCGKPIKWE